MTAGVNWEVFTREEHDAINKLMAMGERDNISGGVLEMTQEKEVELQKIIDSMRPTAQDFESQVMKDYTIERLKKGKPASPETPEEEAELQKALDEEMATSQKNHLEKDKERLEGLENIKPEETPEKEEEEMEEAEEKTFKECKICHSKTKPHKLSCPKYNS